MGNPLIRASELYKTYHMGKETVHALAGVDVEIEKKSFTAVIGPSGSGKSTLLHLLGGLDRPTTGRISVDGLDIDRMDENALASHRRTRSGFIFQTFNLIPNMDALENVAFPLRFNGVRRKEREGRSVELLEVVGLADRMRHRPSELSGGQQQRVAIARAMVNHPEIILADEPTGNLDTQSGLQILELLSEIYRQGRTVIVVSHDPRVTSFADQILCLLDGKIVDVDEYNQALALTPISSEVDLQ